jgi:hypothetical protein
MSRRRNVAPEGIESERFAISMRRTVPRNSSLIFQLAAAALAILLTR